MDRGHFPFLASSALYSSPAALASAVISLFFLALPAPARLEMGLRLPPDTLVVLFGVALLLSRSLLVSHSSQSSVHWSCGWISRSIHLW